VMASPALRRQYRARAVEISEVLQRT